MTSTVAPAAVRHQDDVQEVICRQAQRVQTSWRELRDQPLDSAFRSGAGDVLVAAIAAGQTGAAALIPAFLADELADTDAPDDRVPGVVPAAFGGVTASGIPLAALADLLLFRMLTALRGGMSLHDVLVRGLDQALTYVSTEITDAACTAMHVQLVADRRLAGYERVVQLPACDRCIVLAGRFYRWSAGFRRHPRCRCTMRPVTREQYRSENLDNYPQALFDAMSPAEQDRAFGVGNAAAIRAGADISQVVNTRRGAVEVAGRWTTTAGTTSRGLAGQRLGDLTKTPGGRYRRTLHTRPTAAQLIADHASRSRNELTAALRRYGYLR